MELALVLISSLLLYGAADAADLVESVYFYIFPWQEVQLMGSKDDIFCANRDGNFLGLLQKHYGASKGLGCRDCHSGTALLGPVVLCVIIGWRRRWGQAAIRGAFACVRCWVWCFCVCARCCVLCVRRGGGGGVGGAEESADDLFADWEYPDDVG